MVYVLEASENLRSPEYWNDLEPNQIADEDRGEPATEVLSDKKLQRAGGLLLNAIRGIIEGEYHESDVPLNYSDGEPIKKYPEDTVVILDREYLLWQTNYIEKYGAWPPSKSDSEPIQEPFADYRLRTRTGRSGRSPTDGLEMAWSPDGRQVYVRALLWGVLTKGDYHRLIPTWGFDEPQLSEGAISLPIFEEPGYGPPVYRHLPKQLF